MCFELQMTSPEIDVPRPVNAIYPIPVGQPMVPGQFPPMRMNNPAVMNNFNQQQVKSLLFTLLYFDIVA